MIDVELLQRLLDEATASGEECGCQLVIYQHGRLLADLSSGHVAPGGAAVTGRTLFPVYSVGKGIMATAIHRLAEKGILAYDAKVANYWPEFAASGKADVRIWHILTHRAGLFALPELEHFSDQGNWPLMCAKLAAAQPAWTPGTRCRYHGITFAWLLGETAARAAGKPFDQIIRDEVFAPLGIADFFFGATPEAEQRFAAPVPCCEADRKDWRTVFIGDPAIRRGFIPSANGLASAHAIARIYAATLAEVDGVRLLRPETVANATILRRADDDPAQPGDWAKFGLGYALAEPGGNLGRIFGHGGALGAEGFADRETGLAAGFTKNQFNATHPVHPLRDRISAALGLPIRHW